VVFRQCFLKRRQWFSKSRRGLNELEAGYLNEGEVRHHANHDEDLDDSVKTLMTVDFLREMNHYSHQMC
jgi:hypothetical protein